MNLGLLYFLLLRKIHKTAKNQQHVSLSLILAHVCFTHCWLLSFHEICWQLETSGVNGAALPFLPVTSRGKSQQWLQRSTSVLLSLRKQTVRCRAPWRLSARWESSLALQSSLRVQSWATLQSLLWAQKKRIIDVSPVFFHLKKTACVHKVSAVTLTHLMWDLVAQDSYSCRHASLSRRGEGRPDNQAICKVMKAVSHDYHHSQQRNPLSWEHKASVVLLKLMLRPWQSLWAKQLITKYITFICVVLLMMKGLTLMWTAPCGYMLRRYFCALQVFHWSLQDRHQYSTELIVGKTNSPKQNIFC